MKTLQERIKFVKEVTKWSNAELARKAGVSRTAPTDWLNGNVGALSSPVAQSLSQQTPFTAAWLATGGKPMYKAEVELKAIAQWPFVEIDEKKVRGLDSRSMTKLETAILISAAQLDIDVKKS